MGVTTNNRGLPLVKPVLFTSVLYIFIVRGILSLAVDCDHQSLCSTPGSESVSPDDAAELVSLFVDVFGRHPRRKHTPRY